MTVRAAMVVIGLCSLGCTRREIGEERTMVELGDAGDWQAARHPSLPLEGAELESLVRGALPSAGRWAALPVKAPVDAAVTAARLRVRVAEAAVEPSVVRVRLQLEFRPPLSDESQQVVAEARGQGLGSPETGAKAAVSMALGRGLESVSALLQARTKTDEELIADLASADRARASGAVDVLAARRRPEAFEPLLRQLEGDGAAQALGHLVAYGDVRAVRPIIEAAERDPSIRIEAAYVLGMLGGADALDYLFAVEAGDADPHLRAAAHDALESSLRRAAQTAALVETDPE